MIGDLHHGNAADLGGRGVAQALGAMCGTAVLDKDGLSAALVLADLAAACKEEGRSLQDALDDLARRHGAHVTAGRNVRLAGPEGTALVAATLERFRSTPPTSVAGADVVAIADHVAGELRGHDGDVSLLSTPPTPMVGFSLADGSRLQVRPSGTEPLLKFYGEMIEPVRDEPVAAATARARRRLDELLDAFLVAAASDVTA